MGIVITGLHHLSRRQCEDRLVAYVGVASELTENDWDDCNALLDRWIVAKFVEDYERSPQSGIFRAWEERKV